MYETNEIVTMKKPHPCGGREWKIVRAGADVKLCCLVCGRTVTLSRDELRNARSLPTGRKERKAENERKRSAGRRIIRVSLPL